MKSEEVWGSFASEHYIGLRDTFTKDNLYGATHHQKRCFWSPSLFCFAEKGRIGICITFTNC